MGKTKEVLHTLKEVREARDLAIGAGEVWKGIAEKLQSERQRFIDSNRELFYALDYLLRNFDSNKNSTEAIVKANAAINNAKAINNEKD